MALLQISQHQPGSSPWQVIEPPSPLSAQVKSGFNLNYSAVYICKLLSRLQLPIKHFACRENDKLYLNRRDSSKFSGNFVMFHRDKQVREILCQEDHQHQLLMGQDLCKWITRYSVWTSRSNVMLLIIYHISHLSFFVSPVKPGKLGFDWIEKYKVNFIPYSSELVHSFLGQVVQV